jgi:hypothetical protein
VKLSDLLKSAKITLHHIKFKNADSESERSWGSIVVLVLFYIEFLFI